MSRSWRCSAARADRRVLVRQCRGIERAVRSRAIAEDGALRTFDYGSSRACNATSVGSPADSRSPVALRSPARAGVAVSWRGRFPAEPTVTSDEISPKDLLSLESCTSAPPFGRARRYRSTLSSRVAVVTRKSSRRRESQKRTSCRRARLQRRPVRSRSSRRFVLAPSTHATRIKPARSARPMRALYTSRARPS